MLNLYIYIYIIADIGFVLSKDSIHSRKQTCIPKITVWKRERTLLSTIGMFDDFGVQVHVSFQDSKREKGTETQGYVRRGRPRYF